MSQPTHKPSAFSLLIDLGLIALGVYRLTHSAGRTSWDLTWGVLLIVFGGVGLLFHLIARRVPAASGDPQAAADAILDQQKRVYSGEPHAYRPAMLAEFPRLDATFYDATRDLLARESFRRVGDFENLSLARQFPLMRTVIRTMVGDDGTVVSGIYHIRPGGWMRLLAWVGVLPKHIRSVEFETEFDDGTFVATSNAREANPTMSIPGIQENRQPAATPPLELLRQHRAAVAAKLAADPARRPTVCATAEDVHAFQNRMHALKSAYRQQVGYTNAQELATIRGAPLDARQSAVAAATERARYEQVAQQQQQYRPPPPPPPTA